MPSSSGVVSRCLGSCKFLDTLNIKINPSTPHGVVECVSLDVLCPQTWSRTSHTEWTPACNSHPLLWHSSQSSSSFCLHVRIGLLSIQLHLSQLHLQIPTVIKNKWYKSINLSIETTENIAKQFLWRWLKSNVYLKRLLLVAFPDIFHTEGLSKR
jgi:hypothetical protein